MKRKSNSKKKKDHKMNYVALKYWLIAAVVSGLIGFLSLAQRQYEDRKRINQLENRKDK